MFSTLFVLACLVAPVETNLLWPEFSLECSQEELCIGDTIYISLQAHNPHGKSLFLGDISGLAVDRGSLRFKLVESDFPLLYEVFGGFAGLNAKPSEIISIHEMKPNENRDIGFHALQIPPLEDLHDPNWKKFVKDISPEGKKLTLEVTIRAIVSEDRHGGISKSEEGNRILTHEFLLKPRSSGETALIEKWYQEMPEMFHPQVSKRPPIKIWGWGWMKDEAFDDQIPEEERKKLIVAFHRTGNRYPTYPNAPVTWQGWKELEESLEPSTMRDEIRMTRICIQYLQTRDDSVFEELKEWLADMEEPQRTVMTHDVLVRATNSYGTSLLTPLGQVYHAIDEYYVPIGQTFLREVEIVDKDERFKNNH